MSDFDPPDFCDERIVVARKGHWCVECGMRLAPGKRYQRTAGKWDGEVSTMHTCLPCVRLRERMGEARAAG